MPFTTAIETSILNHFCNDGSWTVPTATFAALSSTTPVQDGTNVTEPTPGSFGYARAEITAANWSAPTANGNAMEKTTATDISFGTCTGTNWGGPFTHVVLYTASTAGTPIAWMALTDQTKSVNIGDEGKIVAGAIVLSIT